MTSIDAGNGDAGSTRGGQPLPRYSVVHVDDDPATSMVVTRVLQREGCAVAHFSAAGDALAYLRACESAVDLLITDFNMPDLNGIELAAAVRAIRPALPVVVSSGLVTEEIQVLAARAGVRRVVRKPDRIQDLALALRAVLRDL